MSNRLHIRFLALFLTLAGPVATTALYAETPASIHASIQVTIKDFMFSPTSLTVKAGSTVTWTNGDDEPHTVVSDDKLFRSGSLDTNESFKFRFEKTGTYHFTCSIHPQMVGTIVVQ